MTRVKRSVTAGKRHKKILKMAKGYRGKRSNVFSQAKNAVMKAGQHAYVGRKLKKRQFRNLWVIRIAAGLKGKGINYSRFINRLMHAKCLVNRKMLSEMATNDEAAFNDVVELAKKTKVA